MSYTSENTLGDVATVRRVREVIELLGYLQVNDGLKIPERVGCYMWSENTDYKSFVGVELDIFKNKDKTIVVTTRSRMGRSYWDLSHQNRTIKTLKGLFGGYFVTDEGRNRCMRVTGKSPSPEAAGCFLARWRLHNALIKPNIYISQRGLEQPNAKREPTGVAFIDEMNPRLFSNNLVLPYAIAVWEEYFRASFIALFKYSPEREKGLKKANLNQYQLESIASNVISVEDAIADGMSFQRPKNIAKNFKIVDAKMDIEGVLRKPYRRRKTSLFDSIEECVEDRNEFVHSGRMNVGFTDKKLLSLLSDIEVSVERCYQHFAKRFNFKAISGYW